MIIHTQIVQIQGAIGGNIHCCTINGTNALSGDIHLIRSILCGTNNLINDTINNDVIRSKSGILSEGQIGINCHNCTVFRLLNIHSTTGCINNQRFSILTDTTGTVGNDRNIAAVCLDVLNVLSGFCTDQTYNRRRQGDLDVLIFSRCCDLADPIIHFRCGVFRNCDIRRCIASSDNIAVGFCDHVALGHLEAEISCRIVANDQICRSTIGNGCRILSISCRTRDSHCQHGNAGFCGEIPVSSLEVLTDLRRETLQPYLLTVADHDGRFIGCSRCNFVKNLIGFCYAQGIQRAIEELSKDIAHPQVCLSTIVDHTVDVIAEFVFLIQRTGAFACGIICLIEFVTEFAFLTQIAEVFSYDVIRLILSAVKLGCEDYLITLNHQIDHKAALGQIKGIGNTVARCCISSLRICPHGRGFDGHHNGRCVFSCHRTVNGQGGISSRIDTARTNYQNTVTQVFVGNVAVDLKSGCIAAASGDFTVSKRVSVLIRKNLYTGEFLKNFCISGKVFVTTVSNIICCAVDQLIVPGSILIIAILLKLMGCFICKVVQIHIAIDDIIVQPCAVGSIRSIQCEVTGCLYLFAFIINNKDLFQKRCVICSNVLLTCIFKFCIRRFSALLCRRSLKIILAVTSDNNCHIAVSNDSNCLFGQCAVFTCFGCSLCINLVGSIAAL